MLLVRVLFASMVVMIVASVPDTARAADSWGCDYDKCAASCLKAGGKHCTTYCERRLQDKRRDKVCK